MTYLHPLMSWWERVDASYEAMDPVSWEALEDPLAPPPGGTPVARLGASQLTESKEEAM